MILKMCLMYNSSLSEVFCLVCSLRLSPLIFDLIQWTIIAYTSRVICRLFYGSVVGFPHVIISCTVAVLYRSLQTCAYLHSDSVGDMTNSGKGYCGFNSKLQLSSDIIYIGNLFETIQYLMDISYLKIMWQDILI